MASDQRRTSNNDRMVITTHDELTGRPILPRDQLRHGVYYRGRCRNALIARWDAERGVFWHWRQKFDRIFLESIKHPADETFPIDVFRVVEEWPNPKFEIPIPAEVVWTRAGVIESGPKAAFTGNRAHLNEHEKELWSAPGWGDAKCPECGTQMQILDSSLRECPSCYLIQVQKRDGTIITKPEGLRK